MARVTIFPLAGTVLYPGLQLPLHIFEPRYRAMVSDALARDRLIGMIQPQRPAEGAALYTVGCLGRIGDVEALEDGRFNIVLEGEARFRVLRVLTVTSPFRQFEREARRFADAQGYVVDWDQVGRLDDLSLINGVSQIAPFDPAAKQALLEASGLGARCELLVQLMQFFGRTSGDDDEDGATLQ